MSTAADRLPTSVATGPARRTLPVVVCFALLWTSLLAATMAWHLPMMLWDHIDLVPIYEAWQGGTLASSGFGQVHDGSHFHLAAYAVLLVTTAVSDGQPWLDALVSLFLLGMQALLLWRIASSNGGQRVHGAWALLLVYLALHPGHLVNLQWGWQVAVFISTLAAVAAIACVTRPRLPMPVNLLAVGCATVGVLGFSTTLVVFPIAVLLVALHPGVPRSRRALLAVPWLAAFALLVTWLAIGRQQGAPDMPEIGVLVAYSLNYLGSGVSRFATALAPAWTIVAFATATWTAFGRWRAELLPWLALMAFGVGCAVLTAIGRAGEFGAGHAFVTRYVSFSSLFWFGWVGLMLVAWRDAPRAWPRLVRPLLALLFAFALANGLHLAKQAREVHARAVSYADHIRSHYPALDPEVMAAAYGGRAEAAQAHLGVLRERGFPPFDTPADVQR
jgi:hypothetical protein